MCKKRNDHLVLLIEFLSFFRDLETVERINKMKKTRTEDSDEEELNAEEDDYDDEEVPVRDCSDPFL